MRATPQMPHDGQVSPSTKATFAANCGARSPRLRVHHGSRQSLITQKTCSIVCMQRVLNICEQFHDCQLKRILFKDCHGHIGADISI